MFKAISSALSFLLILLVLKTVFPEIAFLISEIIVKALNMISSILDQAQSQINT